MSESRTRTSLLLAFFHLLRLNRSMVVAMLTGAAAFSAGAGTVRSLWMTLAGWCLAVGGFSLDFYADQDLDMEGPRSVLRHNPIADGSILPRVSLAFSVTFVAASLALVLWLAMRALVPWFAILAVIIGLALHWFETPIARALTLGLLQGLYVLMGSLAGRLSPALMLLAAMFFFAMFGGRGMIDIRDYPQDVPTRVQTLPKRYGLHRTAQFTFVCLLIAYALSFLAYLTGEFNTLYLYLDLAFIGVGIVGACWFVARPTPRLAHVLTLVFMVGAGFIMCLAMIVGKL